MISKERAEALIKDWISRGLQKECRSNIGLAKALKLDHPRISEMKDGRRRVQAAELPAIVHYLGEPPPRELWETAAMAVDRLGPELQSLWRRLSDDQRQKVIAYAEGMLADRTSPPQPPTPPPSAPSNMIRPRFKPQPEIDTIGGRRPRHVYLAEWLERRKVTIEELADKLEVKPSLIEKLISGRFQFNEDWVRDIADVLKISQNDLYGPPPDEAKPAKRAAQKTAKR